MAAPEPAPRRGREREREEESEDESDTLEERPCGRWQKRREQVNQGNMPGVQSTFLAMDTEEGVEVVWNELHFADRKAFAAHEEKIQTMFEQLVLVDHPNIVKLHKYWLDASEARARVVFITEYVSSGSLKQFLKKTKKNHKAMNAGNGIYPLMNFAAARPLGLPRVLAPPPEEAQKAKTPTPEPFDSETRKVIQMQCNLERSEDKAHWHLTLLLVLEDRLHRQLTYDLLPTDSAQDLAAELVHYGFVHEDDQTKLAAFLESTFLKYLGAQP